MNQHKMWSLMWLININNSQPHDNKNTNEWLHVSSSQGTKLWKTCFIEWEGIQLPCLEIQKLIIYLQLFLEKPNTSTWNKIWTKRLDQTNNQIEVKI